MTGCNMANDIAPGLWLVATPIGNLDDMSPRAVRALCAASVVCCEDTRHSGTLLKHFGVRPERLIVVNEHTEFDATREVVDLVAAGATVALITDAGTPAISDPGQRVVEAVVASGQRVFATPGPAAFVMAATLSALPTERIVFEGFIPRSGSDRRARIGEIAREPRTTVVYEAPHRIIKTIEELAAACGDDRRVSISRELTKMHEHTWRGTLGEAVTFLDTNEPRGEYVIVLEGVRHVESEMSDDAITTALNDRRATGSSTRDAVDEVATIFNIPRKRVYDLAVKK